MSEQPPRTPPADAAPEEPVLPQVSADERGESWGEDPRDSRRDDEWYRSERPPHHGE